LLVDIDRVRSSRSDLEAEDLNVSIVAVELRLKKETAIAPLLNSQPGGICL
jgi:hypothetical protein